MIYFPNCKINLGLYITSRRDDGYHNLETIFYPLPLYDVLEIVPAKEQSTSLSISGKNVDSDMENNIVWKAFQLLQKDYSEKISAADIYLLKNIPMGAGLGGGSADGAYMLKLMNNFYNLELDKIKLADYALQLGSDCPFFIENTPQYATGRGEILSPISIDLSAYSIQVICPQVHISTTGAFKKITPVNAGFDLMFLQNEKLTEWKNFLQNDFEAPVFQSHPELKKIKEQLYEQDALYASMSGSGSAFYGIFNKGARAQISSGIKFEEFYI